MRFEFGQNWLAYVESLRERELDRAVQSLRDLLACDSLEGKTFLDIGCGTGLFSLAALQMQASSAFAVDADPKSVEAARRLKSAFAEGDDNWDVAEGSVLDKDFMDKLPQANVVYCWGVVHHTGRMWDALRAAADKTAEGGVFVFSIYNRCWSSPLWLRAKRLYNRSGPVVRLPMTCALFCARALVRSVRLRNPLRDERGMSTWHDAIDWLGGLPYEFASPAEVREHMRELGFLLLREKLTARNGCNQFVYSRPEA